MVFPINPIAHPHDRLTDDEFYAFCQANRHLRIEREADGQIVFQMPTNSKTGFKNADLITEVSLWNRKAKSGFVSDSNGGYTLPDTSVRAPDVAWVSKERWNALSDEEQDKFAQVCPEFVIELMSDKDEKYTLPAKMEKYLQNGVRLAWMIDPFAQQTTVFRPDAEPEVRAFDEVLRGDDVLPGFELRLREIIN